MNYKILDLIQGSDEWKKARYEHVTGSNVPAIMGISPYKTPLQYAEELLSKTEPPVPDAKQKLFDIGHKVEAAAREWTKSKGFSFVPLVAASDFGGTPVLVSLDGFDKSKSIVFEAKYVGAEVLKGIPNKDLPAHHVAQIQTQLKVMGAEKCVYFALAPNGAAAVAEIIREEKYQDEMQAEITKFWENLKAGILPEMSDKDIFRPDDARFEQLAKKHAEMKRAEKEYESLESLLLEEYSKYGRVQAAGVSVTRYWQVGSVDYSSIPQLKGVDKERFRKAGSLRTKVTVKKECA